MNDLPIFKTLQTDLDVKALLGDRIYEELAPENTATPYAVWQEVAGTADNNLDSGAVVDHIVYQIMIYDPYQVTASKVRKAVCKVLERYSYVTARRNDYETSTKLFSRGFDANWWLNR